MQQKQKGYCPKGKGHNLKRKEQTYLPLSVGMKKLYDTHAPRTGPRPSAVMTRRAPCWHHPAIHWGETMGKFLPLRASVALSAKRGGNRAHLTR